MIVIVLLVATLAFRLLGALGVARFATWRVSAAHGLAVMLVMTASAHFVPAGVTFMPNQADMVAMVPPFVPFPALVVYLTGVLELAGAAGLVLGRTRRAAGICLALLFVFLLPANVYAALAGQDVTPLWQRIPEQVLYIAIALWAAARTRPRVTSPNAQRTVQPPSTTRV
ncbi:DoxX family protein [Nonomuraea jabiensis]|uniref:DoxX family protein n=1 Tax=Nonomuraea jabiensis TaxID=882448 RepID=UPI003D724BF0